MGRDGENNVGYLVPRLFLSQLLEVADEHCVHNSCSEFSSSGWEIDDKARNVVTIDIFHFEWPALLIELSKRIVVVQTQNALELIETIGFSFVFHSRSSKYHVAILNQYNRGNYISTLLVHNFRVVTLPYDTAAIASSHVNGHNPIHTVGFHLERK